MDLVVDGLSSPSVGNDTIEVPAVTATIANMSCPQRAWAAILGVREFSYHEWYNYEYYWTVLHTHYSRLFNKTLSSPPSLYVLRTEHLLEDWTRISKEDLYRQVNQAGTRGNKTPQNDQNQTDQRHDAKRVLRADNRTSTFWKHLCHAMCPELQVYKNILRHAKNLNVTQVQESIQEVRMLCPNETTGIRSCPGIPKFPLMKIPRRQYKAETKKRLFTVG
jgi:hypothetical protein